MQPQKNNFKGKIFVLIDGGTFFAGTEFAFLAKNDHKRTIADSEPSGGNYYKYVGDTPLSYGLEDTQSILKMSLIGINHAVEDKSVDKNLGIIPDLLVPETYENFRLKKEGVLERVLQEIK